MTVNLSPGQLVAFTYRGRRTIYGQSIAWDRNLDHNALIVSREGYPLTYERSPDSCENPGQSELFPLHMAESVLRATERRRHHQDVKRALYVFRHSTPLESVEDAKGRKHRGNCPCASCRFRDFEWKDTNGDAVSPKLGRGRLEIDDIPERISKGDSSDWSHPMERYLMAKMTKHQYALFLEAVASLPPQEQLAYRLHFLGGYSWTGPDGQTLTCPMSSARAAQEMGVQRDTVTYYVRRAQEHIVARLGSNPSEFLRPELAA